jgi:glycerophosphoryl diester phosphodiesterase
MKRGMVYSLLVFVFVLILLGSLSKGEVYKSPSDNLNMGGKLIIAHRGASAYEKDNSYEAFDKAVEMKADFMEFDVRKTQDGVYAVIHDDSVNEEKISDLSYEELKTASGFEVPILENVLKKYKSKIKFDIELKEEGYEKEVLDLILEELKTEDFMITSAKLDSLKKIKEFNSKIKLGLVLLKGIGGIGLLKERLGFSKVVKDSIDFCVENGFEYFIPDYRYLNKASLEYAKEKKISVLVWSIKDKNHMEKLFSEEVIEGIITNKPDVASGVRESL